MQTKYYTRPMTASKVVELFLSAAMNLKYQPLFITGVTTLFSDHGFEFTGAFEQINQTETFKLLQQISDKGILCQNARLMLAGVNNNHQNSVLYHYNDKERSSYAELEFSFQLPPYDQNSNNIVSGVQERLRVIESLEAVGFELISPEKVISKLEIAPGSQVGLATYQNALSDLGTAVARFEKGSIEREKKLDEYMLERTTALEKRYQARTDELNHANTQKLVELSNQENEFREKVKQFDSRENTIVRRDIFDKIRKHIEGRRSFELSKETQSKRKWINVLCVILLLFFLGLATTFAIKVFSITPDQIVWQSYAPMITGVVGFSTTMIFYIRWMNEWFKDHARAEMSNHKYDVDFLRASWLAELFFEEKEKKLPPEMLEQFCQNLFTETAGPGSASHPFEQVIDILKKAGDVKLGPISWTKKGR